MLVSAAKPGRSGMVEQIVQLGFGESLGDGAVGDGVAEFLEVLIGGSGETVVVLGGEDDGDGLVAALDEDGFLLRGIEEDC